jgi:hypothetical protein
MIYPPKVSAIIGQKENHSNTNSRLENLGIRGSVALT